MRPNLVLIPDVVKSIDDSSGGGGRRRRRRCSRNTR